MLIFNQVSAAGLRNLSFHINRGEFVFIYHPDREVLRLLRQLLTGQIKAEAGIIRWFNGSSFSPRVQAEELGVVFAENILLQHRSLGDNLEFIYQLKNGRQPFYHNRLHRIINLTELAGLEDFKPDELLAHQLVRANIAQALLNLPSVLLLEDPTRHLDEVNAQALFHLLEEINLLSLTIICLSSDRGFVRRQKRRTINLKNQEEKDSYAK